NLHVGGVDNIDTGKLISSKTRRYSRPDSSSSPLLYRERFELNNFSLTLRMI
ncbi:unnamed protein product, partial [Rotaria magnacalcarata]